MANPLYNPMQSQNGNIFQRFQQFQQMFKGNPNQQIQQMLNSGQVNQTMYNRAVQMANQFRQMFGGR